MPKIQKTDAEWKALLAQKGAEPLAFDVTRHEATERAFTGKYADHKAPGTYACICCGKPLFDAAAKFESGTGWPSFFEPLPGAVVTKTDFKLLLPRTEYHCARCGGHQGHVFDDGPKPRGERWCNNGVALRFIPQGEALPELRS